MLPPRFDVKLIQEARPPSLFAQLTTAIGPFLAIGGLTSLLILSLGWSYAWHWFAEWNVPYVSMGIGPDHLFEYGRLVVVHFWWVAIIWAMILVPGAWLTRRKGARVNIIATLLIVLILVPWLFGHYLAGQVARANAQTAFSSQFASWPEAHVILRKEHSTVLPQSILANLTVGPDLCYRLFFRAEDGIWLMKMNSIGNPEAAVFLPNDVILYLRLRAPAGADC